MMEMVRLGSTGLKVSKICLGTMTYGSPKWRDWVLHQPGISSPIVRASKLAHLDDAIAAADIELSAEEVVYLSAPYQPKPVIGHK
jgi:aryl-alcohol dehydrogenase-like predicted oxidoreductase